MTIYYIGYKHIFLRLKSLFYLNILPQPTTSHREHIYFLIALQHTLKAYQLKLLHMLTSIHHLDFIYTNATMYS